MSEQDTTIAFTFSRLGLGAQQTTLSCVARGRGVYEDRQAIEGSRVTTTVELPVAGEEEPAEAQALTLRVFPNPSSAGRVTAEVTVPSPLEVTVEVFNALGRRVADVRERTAGSAALPLDLSGYPAGVYLVRLSAEGYAPQTERVTVLP